MHDDLLGELSEDERGNLNGSVPYEGRQVSLLLMNDGEPWEACLPLAKSVVVALPEIDRKGKAAAADQLLSEYNESWREFIRADGQGGFAEVSNPAIAAEEFKAAIRLDSVTIIGDESAALFYDDGALFAGHAIVVTSFDGATFADPHVTLTG